MIVVPSAIVRDLLPSGVAVAEGAIDKIEGALWPQEAELVAKAAPKRRADFTAGRILARRALSVLGGPHGPITRGDGRAPRWPEGFIGSITHCHGYAAAAVARNGSIAGLGIDVEEIGRINAQLESHLFTPDEIGRQLNQRAPDERQAVAALMFCAKEAYYKAQHPLTARWLGFHDVELDLDPQAGAFEAWRVIQPASRLAGRCALDRGLAAAALWISPKDVSQL